MKHLLSVTFAFLILVNTAFPREDVFSKVKHHYADNDGVKIHYVTLGEGPVLLMLHGFPDFWYTWRYQMEELSKDYKVVAVDLRGYNKSDKPKGVKQYTMPILMKDVIAVIDDLKLNKATIISNDWGGAIAWQVATYYPNRVDKFIACNIPHPVGIANYLRENPKTGQYAQDFKDKDAASKLTAEGLAGLHGKLSDLDRNRYIRAFRNSSFEGMLNYYKANYPNPANNTAGLNQPAPAIRKVKSPVLMIYGMKDKALPPGMLNNSWDFVDNEVTIYTIPEAGHFVQQEAHEKVNRVIKTWLSQYTEEGGEQ
ncbi:MAG: alpha/beta hydrolase [Pyrinomonadaceae bacterium]|nr:alpha/beta hydrolase [Pyrinomonadaceae bacterium]